MWDQIVGFSTIDHKHAIQNLCERIEEECHVGCYWYLWRSENRVCVLYPESRLNIRCSLDFWKRGEDEFYVRIKHYSYTYDPLPARKNMHLE